MVRQQLNLDRQPHTAVILRYSEHLQAEAEDLLLGAGVKTGTTVKAAALGVERPPGLPQNGDDGKPQASKKHACRRKFRSETSDNMDS